MITMRKMASRKIDNKINVQNKDDEATIYLYGDIGGWFGIDSTEFIKELNGITAKTIHLRVDSGGGDIFTARAMKTAIMQHKSKVIAHVDGLAASAASFLIMGADEVEIVDGGFLMIHNALSFLDLLGYFNIDDLNKIAETISKEIDLHGKINQSIANDYAKKTGKEASEFLDYMNKETWFTAQEALDIGLVDRVYDGDPVENKYDLSIYNNVPEIMRARSKVNSGDEKEINERDLEKDLRDAGYSRNRAKNIVAKVFRDERDARSEPETHDVRDAQTEAGADQRDAGEQPQAEVVDEVDHIEQAKKLVDPVVELLEKTKQITKKE
ncbi:MAG TPA: head maturation protease, ClpP-related [Patescibacteria group bacterium]|nr:head maturation protease, ClpP-related [Patescibacteria group bacterium]